MMPTLLMICSSERPATSAGSLCPGKPRPKVLLSLVCLLWSVMTVASAATYYVDFEGGSDTADGTSEGTAWKRSPGDENAQATAAGTVLQPGDVVRFKGGVVYSGGFGIYTSGQKDREILFDGNQSGEWGQGRAVIDRNHESRACIVVSRGVSHIIVRGFEIRNSGGYSDNDPVLQTTEPLITSPPGGSGVTVDSGGQKSILLENLFIHRIGQWRNQLPFSGVNSINGVGVSLQNCEGVTVSKCEFTKMRIPVSIKATTRIGDIVVRDCDLHDYFVWGVDIAPRKAGAIIENIAVLNTVIRDYHQYDSGNWLGAGEKPHTDAIFLRTAGMASTWKNIVVAGCFIYTDNRGNSKGGTASIFVSQGPSVDIYNNIFFRDPHAANIHVGHSNPSANGEQVVRIFNNTFIGGPTCIQLTGEKNPDRRSVYIQNNIFHRNGNASSVMVNHQSGVLPKLLDNNLYCSDNHTEAKKSVAFFAGKGYRNMDQLVALGYEANGRFGNPGFVQPQPETGAGLDLRPLSWESVAVGANLSEFFTVDRAGLERPASGPWTVGAHLPVAPSGDLETTSRTQRFGR